MNRPITAALSALALAACATAPTLYQPATGPHRVGYSEYMIEPGRYRITFQGGPGAPAEYVSDLALLRAADLALAAGYDWFRVSDRFLRGEPDHGPYIGLGVGGGSFDHNSAVGGSISNGFSLGGGPTVASTIEVIMGRGPPPRGQDVYDAHALRQTLGGRV